MKWIGQHIFDLKSKFRNDVDITGDVTITGTLDVSGISTSATHFVLGDDDKIKLGTGDDGEIYVNGDDLYIKNVTSDKDIIFQSDDGSGGTETYFFLDGSSGYTQFPDSKQLSFGSDNDMRVYSNGSTNFIISDVGDLSIQQKADDKDIIFKCDDGSGGTTAYLTLDGSEGHLTVQKEMNFGDNVEATFGASNDLKVYHSGSHSYMIQRGTGNLYIQQTTNDADIIFTCDDGSGGNTAYLTLDGSVGFTTVQKLIKFEDSVHARFGNGSDLRIFHDGSNSEMNNHTGHLSFINYADDKDIIFKSDDGSGGVETYFFLDGSMSSGNPWTIFPDQSRLGFGDGLDLRFYHDGTNSYVENEGGNLYIRNDANDKDIIFQCDDGSDGAETYFFLDGSEASSYLWTKFPDNSVISLGTGNDFTFWHDGTNTNFKNHTGDLIFTQNTDDADIIFKSDDGSGGVTAYLTLDGSATQLVASKNLKFDQDNSQIFFAGNNTFVGELSNSGKLQLRGGGSTGNETVYIDSSGNLGVGTSVPSSKLDVRGTLTVGVDDTGHDVFFYGATSGRYLHWDESDDSLKFKDNVKAKFGDGNDLAIHHSGSQSEIKNLTGNLIIENTADDADITFKSDNGSGGTAEYFRLDGGDADGTLTYTKWADNGIVALGSGKDLRMYHNGTNSIIQNYTGNLSIRNGTNDGDIIFDCDDGSGGLTAYLTLDGGAEQVIFSKDQKLLDDVVLKIGGGGDLRLQHSSGNNSGYIQNYTGDLYIENTADDKDISFRCDDGAGGVTPYLTLDGSRADGTYTYTTLPDSGVMAFGASVDMQLYHNATDSIIRNNTGDLKIINYADDKDIIFQSDDGSGGTATYFFLDGSQANTNFQKDVIFADNKKALFGGSGDLQIYHDGSNSFITDAGTGDLYVEASSNFFLRDETNNQVWISGATTGVTLRYQDNVKLATVTGGVNVTGELEADSLDIDGVADISGTVTLGTPLATDQQKHVMHYQLAGYGTGDGTNYETTQNLHDTNAPFEHNISVGSDGTTALTVANMSRTGGHIMPRACTLKRWTGWATCVGSQTAYIGLFKVSFTRNDATDLSLVLLDEFSYTAMGNNAMEDFDETSFTATALAAGDMIITAIKSQSGYIQYFNSTVEVEF